MAIFAYAGEYDVISVSLALKSAPSMKADIRFSVLFIRSDSK